MIQTKSLKKKLVLTRKENEVIEKKLKNKKLTQQDSNYLSRYIRPKLREIKSIDATGLLEKLEYNQKIPVIEKKIKDIVLEKIKGVDSITIYGSAVRTNYNRYEDIDVLIVVKKKLWKNLSEKYKMIIELKERTKEHALNLDVEMYDKKTFKKSYPSNITLIYQLKDKKTIYGRITLPKKIEIPKLNLRMKIDYSIPDEEYSSLDIYKAIRNLLLVELISRKIIDNQKLTESINDEIGKNIAERLKANSKVNIDKKIGLLHLDRLLAIVLKKIEQSKWEKIELLNQ